MNNWFYKGRFFFFPDIAEIDREICGKNHLYWAVLQQKTTDKFLQ